jgi:ATP-binding cassette subfamily C (CFTR/MRP) protein 1
MDKSSTSSERGLLAAGDGGIALPKLQVGVSDGTQSSYEQTSALGWVIFSWLNGIIETGTKKILEYDDVPLLPKEFSSAVLYDQFLVEWNKEIAAKGKDAKVSMALYRSFRRDWLVGSLCNVPYIVVVMLQPYFVLHLLFFIIDGHSQFLGIKSGMGMAACLGVLSLLSSASWSISFSLYSQAAARVRGALMAAIFQKSLRLSNSARGKHTTGEIMTLMSADVERLFLCIQLMNFMWFGPILCLIAMILLCFKVGVSAVPAIGALFLLYYLQRLAGNYCGAYRRRLVKFTDERVKITNELLQGIRVVKYYAWEYPMKQKVTDIRNQEVALLTKYQCWKLVNSVLGFVGPSVVSFSMFMCYVLLGENLTLPSVYTAYALLNIVRLPLMTVPIAYTAVCEAIESLQRLTKFLLLEDVPELRITPQTDCHADTTEGKPPLVAEIKNASFGWNDCDLLDHEPARSTQDVEAEDDVDLESTAMAVVPSSYGANLEDINFSVREGEFIAVIGSVGSGKSSLIAALLGQMKRLSGEQYMYAHVLPGHTSNAGQVALVAQEHWIQNLSLVENVLFGNELDETIYASVLDASQLSKDLLSLPHGDATSIGERGINLSGGQKARVSIARALYHGQVSSSTVSMYIFDDSLAAVDVHVGKAIFHEAFQGMLAGKTRIVAMSSNYHLLPEYDRVCVIKHGRIAAFGTSDEVLRKFPEYTTASTCSSPVRTRMQSMEEEVQLPVIEAHSDDDESKDSSSASDEGVEIFTNNPEPMYVSQYGMNLDIIRSKRQCAYQLMTEEERERGAVDSSTYVSYFAAAVKDSYWGGVALVCGIMFMFALGQVARVISDMWVGQWAIHGIQTGKTVDKFYMHWYIVLVIGTVVLAVVRGACFVAACMGASRNMHDMLLLRILRAPINTYFDVTPLGRIINKFSKDLDNMDSLLPDFFVNNLQNGFQCLFIFIVCITATPFMLFVLGPAMLVFYRYQRYFRQTSRELKRLDAMSRSPMYSLFTEVLNGLITIRAYRQQSAFVERFFALADQQSRNFFVFYFSNRWLAIRLDLLSSLILMAVALLTTGLATAGNIINPNYLGLALVYSLQLTGLLQWTVRIATETETNMTSVERLLAFKSVQPEETWLTNEQWMTTIEEAIGVHPDNKQAEVDKDKGYELVGLNGKPRNHDSTYSVGHWPTEGHIMFRNLRMRYRPELGLVLKGLNLTVPGGKRIGICGRTGAGKSSLMLALFRIVQVEAGSSVIIDGRDINDVSLCELRSSLTIIPQDPVMFSGTLRSNLDPFNKHTEAELWNALDRAHLKDDVINKFPKKLGHEVSE